MAPGKLLKFGAVSFVLPFTLNFYVYYGFISNYSSGAFSRSTFLAQFETGIYKYRILGTQLILFVNDTLETYGLGDRNSERLKFLDSQASAHFYDSYFILNTAFLCLTGAVLYLTYNHKVFEISSREKYLWIVVLLFYMALSQFAVVPYDTLSYFIMCAGMYFILSARHSAGSTVALFALVVLGTLTRESIALLLSFYATVYFLRFGFTLRKSLLELLLLTAAFLGTYLSLRVIYGFDHSIHQGLLLHDNMGLGGIISILFFLSTLTILILDVEKAKIALIFLLFSSPYIAMILLFGALFEIRLWIPLIIPIAILTSLNPRSIKLVLAEPFTSEGK